MTFSLRKIFCKSFFKKLLLLAGMAFVSALIGSFIILKPYYRQAKKYDLSKLNEYNVTTYFYDKNGEEIGQQFIENRTLLSRDEIPELMRQAVIAAEDKRFFSHHGIDISSISRALIANLKEFDKRQGGSTITQQLAKHLIGNFERTLRRKLVEAFLARRIEARYSKDEILTFYLNRIYFGKGYFGLASAAKGYFGKTPKELSLEECALLAGLIRAPNTASPRNNGQRARYWRDVTLDKMCRLKFITPQQAAMAQLSEIKLTPESERELPGIQSYFMALASRELEQVLHLNDEVPQGLRVYTTLDLQMQKAAENDLKLKLQELEQSSSRSESDGPLQGAVTVMDLQTGALRVLIGGRNFRESPFDRATMARRENGALLQPFLYALAFQHLDLCPASMVNAGYLADPNQATPEELALGDPHRDLGKRFLTIQDALALTQKACATRIGLSLGVDKITQWLQRARVTESYSHAESLWALKPLTLLELSSLYQCLGNSGLKVEAFTIEKVLNVDGETLYEIPEPKKEELLPSGIAQQMTLTLQCAARDGNARGVSEYHQLPLPWAGMSAFSEGYRDAWFVGYSPIYVSGVWIGYDESRPIGNRAVAKNAAIPLWADLMQKIFQIDSRNGKFLVPETLSKVEVDRQTGIIKGQGFLAPSAGSTFAYLTPSQIKTLSATATAVEQNRDWSDWLGTLLSDPGCESPLNAQADNIPVLAEYKMPGLRGDIISRDGKILATTDQVQSLVIAWPTLDRAPDQKSAVEWMKLRLDLVSELLKQPNPYNDQDLQNLYEYQRFRPVMVIERLTQEQSQKFQESSLAEEKGIAVQGIPMRRYPMANLFFHGLGYLKKSQTQNKKQYQADEVIYDRYEGADGLERVFDKELTGKDGRLLIATTTEGFTRQTRIDAQATVGCSLKTTIDSRVQSVAEECISHLRAGAVVILDPNNGDVIAMASTPTLNANSFLPSISASDWNDIIHSPKSPLMNRAYRQRHPPGSTFKVITSLAAMRAGVFDPNRVIDCPGYVRVGNVLYNLPLETQSVSFRAAVARSYNTYFIDLGLRAGRTALLSAARDMGIGQLTGFILPNEDPGLMPDPEFVLATHHRNMGAGDVANSSIGQGDVLVTPLQMANWMTVVANGGTLYRPRLVSELRDSSGNVSQNIPTQVIREISIPEGPLQELRRALVAVTEEGTATGARVPGISVAAKTGTAQIGMKSRPRQVAWIGGYIPAENPRYAFSIMVEGDYDQELHGGTDAGHIASKIFSRLLNPQSTAANP
jgi:penicillin-binding protein 2